MNSRNLKDETHADVPAKLSRLPLVSIVVICKDADPWIRNCIDSILQQDYSDIEIIVQDGASTDGTVDALRHYPSNVRVYSENDTGIGDALDRGLRRAKGEVIGILSADERYLPGAIVWAVEAFTHNEKAGAVFGDCVRVNSNYERLELKKLSPITFEELFCVEKVIPCPTAFLRTKHLIDVGKHSDPNLKTCPDFELWVRLGLKHPIVYVPGAVAENMVHEDSSTCQPAQYELFVKIKKEIIERITSSPDTPSSLRKLRRRALAGLYGWAAQGTLRGDASQAVRWAARSICTDPRSILRYVFR